MSEAAGTVIFLNGTSSSGKTSIARELQQLAKAPYLHLSIDAYLHQLPISVLTDGAILVRELPKLMAGFNASNAAIARAGNNIIVDTVWEQRPWIDAAVAAFAGLDVYLVAVRCPLEVLEQREQARGDRKVGLARLQYERVHAHGIDDTEVDTSVMTPRDAAAHILSRVQSGTAPTAFARLRLAAAPPKAN